MSSCLIQRHFSNRFLYCISYILLFYTSNKYSHKMLICNFFFNFTQWFQALAKGLIMFIYMLYCFLLSKSKMRATKKSCLPGFLSWGTLKPHFLRFETKLLQIFFFSFYCSQNYILLANYIRDSWRLWSCHFVSPLPLLELQSVFPLRDLWLKYYREN